MADQSQWEHQSSAFHPPIQSGAGQTVQRLYPFLSAFTTGDKQPPERTSNPQPSEGYYSNQTQIPLAETQPDGCADDNCPNCQNEPTNLANFIRSQIQGRRQFIWDEMDDLDRHERSLDDPAVIKTLELLDTYAAL